MYNTILKVVFLSTSYATIYLIRNQYKHTYDKENDTFRMIFLVMPCFVLACFINYYPNPQEVRDTSRARPSSAAAAPRAAATHAVHRACRSCGRSPSISSRWRSCRSCSCCRRRRYVARRPLRRAALPPASAGAPAACVLCSSLRACVLRLVGRWQVTDVLTWHYVFCMGMYRAFYLLNWVWRYMTQEGYSDWIVWVAGIVQTILYLDFFYYYIKCKLDGKQVALPQ